MPLTDLRSITLPLALRYTSRFGLNRSQGTYFYQIVRKSPPDTYLADLKHLSQPSSTSLLGRLLREACGTLPQLIPQEPVRDNTQSRRAWYNFEMKYGPSRMAEPAPEPSAPPTTALSDQKVTHDPASAGVITLVRHPTSPPPATRPSFATLSVQQLPLPIPISVETPPRSADTCQYLYPHTHGVTNTQSSFTSPINDSNLHPQYLHYYSSETSTHSEPIQQDDMDCLPPSPFLSSDVDMDVLTDTEPAPPSYDHIPWTQWIPIPEYVPVPPLHNMFAAPQSVSIRQADTHAYWDAAINDLPGHTFASAAPEFSMDHHNLPTYHPGSLDPINVTSDRTQDTVETHWQEPPHRAGAPDPTSVATLLDEFERSLTLVADDTPSSEADNRNDRNCHLEPTPACVIKDERRISCEPIAICPPQTNASDAPLAMLDPTCSIDHPDDSEPGLNSVSDAGENNQDESSLFERESTEPLGEGACFLNLRDSPPPPFDRESTEPLEDDQDQLPVDPLPPWFERETTEPLEQDEDRPSGYMLDQPRRPLDPVSLPLDTVFEASFTRPRQLTPPPSHRTKASHDTSTNKRTTRQSIARLVATARAVLDAKRLATNNNQDRIDLAQASVQARKRAQLQASLGGARVLRPILARCGMGRREEGEGEEEAEKIRPASDRRERVKRTRFLVPDAEGDAEEDLAASTLARPRRTRGANKTTDAATSALAGSSSSRRTTASGPPRSILRNARATAMPYQKAAVRHAGRRASVP
ncbi:hypothetical protein J3R82DRAFT_7238 [Butyriboletus roseoflavus]|nr:hypothetical protein J3R82DRAFT_7238 [Butyriboletus roseoflavus]